MGRRLDDAAGGWETELGIDEQGVAFFSAVAGEQSGGIPEGRLERPVFTIQGQGVRGDGIVGVFRDQGLFNDQFAVFLNDADLTGEVAHSPIVQGAFSFIEDPFS